MGTEALWVPLLLSAAGAGVSGYNSYDAAKRQDRAAAAGIRQQQARQQEANARINQELGSLEKSNPNAEREMATDEFLQQLRATRGAAEGPSSVPTASGRAAQEAATGKAAIANYGQERGRTLAGIAAPTRQRQAEGRGLSRMGSDVAQTANFAQGDKFLNDLRIKSIQKDPWLDALGTVLSAAGAAYGMAGAGAGAGLGTGSSTSSVFNGVGKVPVHTTRKIPLASFTG